MLAKSCIQSGCEGCADLIVCEGPEEIQISKYKIEIPSQITSNPLVDFSLILKYILFSILTFLAVVA